VTAVLLLTAVRAEAVAALGGFDGVRELRIGPYEAWAVRTPAGEVVAVAGGVGPARAAAAGAYALGALSDGVTGEAGGDGAAGALSHGLAGGPGGRGTAAGVAARAVVVVAGIGGGFVGRAAVGDVVVADRIVHADLGADSPGGFLPVAELGFGVGSVDCAPELVTAAAGRTGAVVGAIVTVSTVTGTAGGATELAWRHGPAAEGMEGAGGWAAAEAYGLPVLEIRAIANLVGPRDRAGWEIPRALGALRQAMTDLLTEPLS
jgi:futalosine hydrolase